MKTKQLLAKLQNANLQSQGLNRLKAFGKGKKAVLETVEHLGYVQIDTLAVVTRAHHHTLWTRVPDYQNDYLHQLVEDRKVFEYWFHAASYLPMRDFRYALPRMSQFKRGEARYYKNVPQESIKYVYDKIRIDGPQKNRDFKSESNKLGSWWNWKPTKMALEKLFMQGDLMISGRDKMEKIYELTERVLPEGVDTSEPDPMELAEYLVRTYLRAYGFTTIKQITHLKTGQEIRNNVKQVLQGMLEEKTIQQIDIDDLPTIYAQNDLLDSSRRRSDAKVRLLSPFDNAIIHRDRVKQIYNYDYRLESYIPKPKREFGYFCLPILFKGKFVGRVDCKAHRKNGQFELINLYIEDDELDLEIFMQPFVETILRFANFNGCQSINVSKVHPFGYTEQFQKALSDI
ncbi:MAG: crosslink repair DNA glycosylase YcaQ family protein [Bacteroidota bacterium]